MPRLLLTSLVAGLALGIAGPAAAQTEPPGSFERLTFDAAVERALERNATVKQAAQAILRSQGLLDQAKAVIRPVVYGDAASAILDAARGFDGNVTQPRTQWVFNATASVPFLAPAQWAAKSQAADQVEIARISAEETRRQVAVTAAEAYFAVVVARRQRDVVARNRETAAALADYARARLQAGQGSKLNYVRSAQELATAESLVAAAELAVRRAQEALGVAVFADGPIDADGDPQLPPAATPSSDDDWLGLRPDVRLSFAQLQAADRVMRDDWKSWMPTGAASFTPRYVTPAGLFEPAKTWRALFQLQLPIFDGALAATRQIRRADRETATLRFDAVKLEARAELRAAREAVARVEQIVATTQLAAESAAEALRITEIAYKAGATSNIEVVQAQQSARNSELVAAQAEDRLRQARLDLLVALGQFPR